MKKHIRFQIILDQQSSEILMEQSNKSAYIRDAIKAFSVDKGVKRWNHPPNPEPTTLMDLLKESLLKKFFQFFCDNEDHIPLNIRQLFIDDLTTEEKVIIDEL